MKERNKEMKNRRRIRIIKIKINNNYEKLIDKREETTLGHENTSIWKKVKVLHNNYAIIVQ